MNGWLDEPRQAVLLYRNLATPRKLVIGPWYHTQTRGFDKAEHSVDSGAAATALEKLVRISNAK
jgi:predicted acyl esterase